MLFDFLKNLFSPSKEKKSESFNDIWNGLLTGDHVQITIKDPRTVGIIANLHQPQTLTYQRLDEEDISTRTITGYIISKEKFGTQPAIVECLKVNAIKKQRNKQKFVEYFLLKEEIQSIKIIE